MRRILAVTIATLLFGPAGAARGGPVVLDFQDIPIPGETDTILFTYQSKGFTIVAENPPTGFLSGLQAHGSGSIFFMGERGLSAFAPATSPLNVITLTQDGGDPFSLLSIDLARNFAFDPAPTVTFTGVLAGGGTVTETFTVTTPTGVSEFQTFHFTGFTDVVSVSWGQPPLADGTHQFGNIRIESAAVPVPEPGTLALALVGAGMGIALGRRRRG